MFLVHDYIFIFIPVAFKEKQDAEPPKTEKAPAAADKSKGAKGGKGGKDKGGKDKDGKGSRPPSQQFDIGKPHWTLRVVSDASCSVSDFNCYSNCCISFVLFYCIKKKIGYPQI